MILGNRPYGQYRSKTLVRNEVRTGNAISAFGSGGYHVGYHAGSKTLRQIGEEHGCSHVAVKKRAEREGWTRDLSVRIKEAADAKVTKAEVTKEVTKESAISERQIIETNAMVSGKVSAKTPVSECQAIDSKMQVDAETRVH